MQIVVDGLLSQYELTGKGRLVVLLHGWGDNSRGLAQLQKELGKSYQVLAIDLPGFGGTQAPAEAWGLDEYARFVATVLRKLQLKPYAVIGHSNGGAIAIRGLGQETFTAERLVLLASAGIRGTHKGKMKALRYATKAGKALTTPLPAGTKEKLRRKVYEAAGSDMLVAEHLQATFKKVVSDDVQADAAKIDQPTLLIYGEADEQAPVWYGEKFHELISDSTLEILPGAGHFVHLDRPSEVVRAIEEFLR